MGKGVKRTGVDHTVYKLFYYVHLALMNKTGATDLVMPLITLIAVLLGNIHVNCTLCITRRV